MSTNPESVVTSTESPEVCEVQETTRAGTDRLKGEVETTSSTKSEIKSGFGKFLEKLKNARGEFKDGHISKAVAVLFGKEEKQESSDSSVSQSSQSVTQSTGNDVASSGGKESLEKEPADSTIVSVKDYIKDIKLDMRYATTNNFTGKKIYESSDAKLRYGTVKKLKVAQDELSKKGYSIKIWDAYRPQSAQEKLRSIRPDPALVADPKKGSAHTRGNTVDITLVKSDGTEIPMPSEFDDNNKKKIDRDYSDLSKEQASNAKILEDAMKSAGFKGYSKEWWHYSDIKGYPMERGD